MNPAYEVIGDDEEEEEEEDEDEDEENVWLIDDAEEAAAEDEDADEDEENVWLMDDAEEAAAEDAYLATHVELLQLLSHCLRGETTAALLLADQQSWLVNASWGGGQLSPVGQGYIYVTWVDDGLSDIWRDDTAIMIACNQGNLALVRGLLAREANAQAQTRYGWHALMNAADGNHCDIMRVLLDQGGVGVDLPAASTGWTSLHIAADFNCREACLLLVSRGANIRSLNNQGSTPIQVYGGRARPRMATADIEEAREAVLAAFAAGPHPDARWARRRDFIMTLVGSGLRSTAAAKAAEAAKQAALDKSAPLPPISRATPALNRDYLVRHLFSQEAFVRLVVAFL